MTAPSNSKPPEVKASSAWYESAFGADYLTVYGHRSPEEARIQVAWIRKVLGLDSTTFVLDCACGNGRHVAALKDLDVPVFGADLSPELLAASRALFGALPLVRHDMRALPYLQETFSAVLLLFTSFGYFSSDEEHLRVLSDVRRVLAPGGVLLLDFMNAVLTLKNLQPESVRAVGELTITERRSYDPQSKRINKTIEIFEPGRGDSVRTYNESVRAFSESELVLLLEKANFSIEFTAGHFEGSAFSGEGISGGSISRGSISRGSPRLIIAARRGKRSSN